MPEDFLTLEKYQDQAKKTDRKLEEITFPMLGLFGEVGTLLSEAKKQQRDTSSYIGYTENVLEELGDVLWYLAAVTSRTQLSIADIAYAALLGGEDCHKSAPPNFRFIDLQNQRPLFPPQPSPSYEKNLLRLAGSVGSLLDDYRQAGLDNYQAVLSKHIINVFRILILVANDAGVTLDQAAKQNLRKIFDRWPIEKEDLDQFDENYPNHEQLPRELSIDIFECSEEMKGLCYVIQRCNEINIGERLTDNIGIPDDYRFHDVFHYAYAAVLGWSPVVRALLRLKRKSNSRIDEGEDGARAIIVEEGVSAWIFGQAKQLNFFYDVGYGDLSFDLLKGARKFVTGYEVECRPLWLWEEAILQGYAAFRYLKQHRQGRFHIDMYQRILTFESIPT